MQAHDDMENNGSAAGVLWVAAGFAFLVAVAVALMSDKTAAPPDAAVTASPPPATDAGQAASAGTTAEPPAATGGSGAQPPAEVRAALEGRQAPSGGLVTRVYFATGSAELDDSGRASVEKAARTLSAGLASRIALSGYVDASGSADANAELAKQRAKAVRDALLAAGVPAEALELRKPQQITAEGGADEARRVEIVLLR